LNRAELLQLTEDRIQDARALIRGKRWSFAYYVAGYAVECALKSCLLARMIHTGWVFEEKAKIADCLTHDYEELIRIAGLTDELNASFKTNRAFVLNWKTVIEWKVTDRYGSKTKSEALKLHNAIFDEPDGVLPWIKKFW
jgi:HEPN domain-containing protein